MKVDQAEYDAVIAANTNDTIGYTVTMQTGDGQGAGQQITQHFIVDPNDGGDPITEIGRMAGNMINTLSSAQRVTEDEANKFRILWKKIIKA